MGREDLDKRKGLYYDDWSGLVRSSNSTARCGFRDWRVPNREELFSIAHLGKNNPGIDGRYFPNTQKGWYWSSSPYAKGTLDNDAWRLPFFGKDANVHFDRYRQPHHVRLVRGEQ
jgi:hypothetical protein